MSTMAEKPRNALEEYNALVDFTTDSEMAQIEALSAEELEAQLVAAGFYDEPSELPPEVTGGAATPEPPSGRVVPFRPRSSRTRWAVFLVAAAIAATTGIMTAATLALRDPAPSPPTVSPPPRPSQAPESVYVDEDVLALANAELDDAERAKARKDWESCFLHLRNVRAFEVPVTPRATKLYADCEELYARMNNAKAVMDGGF